MIALHHGVRPYRVEHARLVEPFRRADWNDFTMGLVRGHPAGRVQGCRCRTSGDRLRPEGNRQPGVGMAAASSPPPCTGLQGWRSRPAHRPRLTRRSRRSLGSLMRCPFPVTRWPSSRAPASCFLFGGAGGVKGAVGEVFADCSIRHEAAAARWMPSLRRCLTDQSQEMLDGRPRFVGVLLLFNVLDLCL